MKLTTPTLIATLFGIILLLCAFTVIAVSRNGESLQIKTGQVQKCVVLGGVKNTPIAHATIKADDGSYIIAGLKDCQPDSPVTIFVKRGALYFNTVFAAEIIR